MFNNLTYPSILFVVSFVLAIAISYGTKDKIRKRLSIIILICGTIIAVAWAIVDIGNALSGL